MSADLLREYHSAVQNMATDYLVSLRVKDLDDVVDDTWDPPVTRGVRLVSVVNDATQHVGQAAFVRGLWEHKNR